MKQDPKPQKIYCAWWTAGRDLKLLPGTLDAKGNAQVKDGPAMVKVVAARCGTYRGRPVFAVRNDEGEAMDVWGQGQASLISATEYDEACNNNYAEQAMTELTKPNAMAARDWILIAAVGFLVILNIYGLNETKDAINAIGQRVAQAHPAPPPAVAFVFGLLGW